MKYKHRMKTGPPDTAGSDPYTLYIDIYIFKENLEAYEKTNSSMVTASLHGSRDAACNS